MNRWLWFAICALGGVAMLVLGLLMPIHLRAVDANVIRLAGERPPSLIQHGMELLRDQKLGPARLLLQAIPKDVPDRDKFSAAVDHLAAAQPALVISGGNVSPRMERLFGSDPQPPKTELEPLTDFVVKLENREVVLEFLQGSRNPAVQQLLLCRQLTNTLIFEPSTSTSGQAFDAAIVGAGLLMEENELTGRLREKLSSMAAAAIGGQSSEPLEQALLDLMSLSQRFNWGQLVAFTGRIEDTETLRLLAEQARHDDRLPVLFAAVELSGQPAAVEKFLMDYSTTGLSDLRASLRYGGNGVTELVRRDQRLIYPSDFNRRVAALPVIHSIYEFEVGRARWTPQVAMGLKWFFYLASGFLLAVAMHFVRPAISELDKPLQVPGYQYARESLFALGFLAALLLVSEPFLSDENQRTEFPIHIHLPNLVNASNAAAKITQTHTSIMNSSLLTLLLFFVLQGLLYACSLVKLSEIRRQPAPPRVKLKLLENEDHLFDAGLYLGFVGTIISFILASLGITKLSLMGAYSSTSFGIIFVSVFKIFQLRPARRKILLEAEAASPEVDVAPITARAMPTAS